MLTSFCPNICLTPSFNLTLLDGKVTEGKVFQGHDTLHAKVTKVGQVDDLYKQILDH